jgi:hypothetical protein
MEEQLVEGCLAKFRDGLAESAPLIEVGQHSGVDLLVGSEQIRRARSNAVSGLCQRSTVQPVARDGVLSENLAAIGLRHPSECCADPVPCVGPGSLRMRIVASEHHLTDTDLVADLDFCSMDE